MAGKKLSLKRWAKCALCLLLCLSMICILPPQQEVQAASSITEIQNKLEQLKKEAAALQKQLDSQKNDKKKQQQYKASLDKQIANVSEQLSLANQQVKQLDARINEKTSAIEEKVNAISESKELLKKRICAIYMGGEMSDLDYIFNSEGVMDYLYRYELLRSVTEKDAELIDHLKTEQAAIQEELDEIEEARKTVAETKKHHEEQKAYLAKLQKESAAVIAAISQQITSTQSNLNAKNKLIDAEDARLQAMIKEQGSSGSGTVSSATGKFGWPLPGYYTITDRFGAGRSHRGLDIAGPTGAKISAAEAGTVIFATNQNTAIYGKYLIIDHGNGLTTLYGHCNSVAVKVGDKVRRGQYVATVGRTGVATGPHLHIGVLVNGVAVNPEPYLPMP